MRMRRLAEEDGRPFSRYTVEEPDGYQCVATDVRKNHVFSRLTGGCYKLL
jgi:hypothetical protein